MIWQGEMLGHRSIYPAMFNIQSMSLECILSSSNVLDGALSTFNKVDHISGSTISSGFYTKVLAGCLATK